MTKIKNISFKFSCLERYDDMKLQNDGRFCDSCEKLVYDFTDKTLEDLEQIKKENKGSVCGRFKKSQLNLSFYKYAAATVIAASSLAIDAEAQVNPQNNNDSTMSSESVIIGDIEEFDDNEIYNFIIENELPPEENESFDHFIVDPKYPEYLGGGVKGLYEFFNTELVYPSDLKLDGKVFVEFIVDEEGNIMNPKIVRGLSPDADKEALRLFNLIPDKFTPFILNGELYAQKMIIPIIFKKQ
ncbi:energy transducer TonB [Aureibacter tunicatorum]|uniref:TonB C-terminal domain-containing protein n=1 Tax=Aureibacter tunicatorum TaxID=866807 RepID=A0AAE3XQ14_9BACT|nr:energy transducer TonB [Aureibacter tunicatorum]MDR6240603.1 hypothetical protein [Aureibacter tunicatorum]BDD06536.1 hypothetical protein AUTU_40190 [Aureibacter tunicatorum]